MNRAGRKKVIKKSKERRRHDRNEQRRREGWKEGRKQTRILGARESRYMRKDNRFQLQDDYCYMIIELIKNIDCRQQY